MASPQLSPRALQINLLLTKVKELEERIDTLEEQISKRKHYRTIVYNDFARRNALLKGINESISEKRLLNSIENINISESSEQSKKKRKII